MFAYIFISSILYLSSAEDLLSELWEEHYPYLSRSLKGLQIPEEQDRLLIGRLSKLPFTERVKSDVWYRLIRYRSIQNLELQDWQKYEPLIPYLPLSLLREVNFSDDGILTYFGQQKLSQVQLPHLAEEAVLRSKNILEKESEILKLGNIICGFAQNEIATIKESVLRSLLEKNFFRSIQACTPQQLAHLSKLMKQYTVIGPPRTWLPETVKKAGHLIAGLKPLEIREIRDRSFSQISPEVIHLAPLEILKVMKDSQLRTLNRSALLAWRRRTLDLRELYKGQASSFSVEISLATFLPAVLSICWKGNRIQDEMINMVRNSSSEAFKQCWLREN